MALVSRPDMSILWAEAGARIQPSNAKVGTGWTSEIPPHQWENWEQYRQDQGIKYLFQRGIPQWDATEDYAGSGLSVTIGSDGNLYKSVQASGPSATVVNPTTNTSQSHWVPITKTGDTASAGLVRLATVGEHVSGTSSTIAATPAGIQSLFSGIIVYFPQNVPPAGFMVCDGSAVSRTTYANLFDRIGTRWGAGNGTTTFNLPDLRGEFIRGWDSGRGINPSRTFGSVEMSQNLAHTHGASSSTAGEHTHTSTMGNAGAHTHDYYRAPVNHPGGAEGGSRESNGNRIEQTGSSGAHTHTLTIQSAGGHSHTITVQSEGGAEARPRNVALLPCIKY